MVQSGMFFGYYEHSLDNKGRLVIPSKMRSELGLVVYVNKGFDGALSLYTKEGYQNLLNESKKRPFNKKNSRDYLRILFASTYELEIDKQGRIQLPSQMIEKYSLGKDFVIIGVGDHVELWDMKTYKEYEEKAIGEFEKIAESLQDDDE